MDRCGAVSSLTSTAKRRETGPRQHDGSGPFANHAGGAFFVLKAGIPGYVSSYLMKKVNLVRYIPDPCVVSP